MNFKPCSGGTTRTTAATGAPTRVDYEYERKGVSTMDDCEPCGAGARAVTERYPTGLRRCVRELVEVHYPQAIKIRLVQAT